MGANNSGTLASFVHVCDDQGSMHVFGPDTPVPEWAARRITNPRAWATPPNLPTAEGIDQGGAGSGKDAGPAGDVSARPPKSGKGAGRPDWAAFATHLGVGFTDDDNRDAIAAKVEEWETEQATKPAGGEG